MLIKCRLVQDWNQKYVKSGRKLMKFHVVLPVMNDLQYRPEIYVTGTMTVDDYNEIILREMLKLC